MFQRKTDYSVTKIWRVIIKLTRLLNIIVKEIH